MVDLWGLIMSKTIDTEKLERFIFELKYANSIEFPVIPRDELLSMLKELRKSRQNRDTEVFPETRSLQGIF